MKEKGNSWTEVAVALVSLGLFVALFLLGVGLRGLRTTRQNSSS